MFENILLGLIIFSAGLILFLFPPRRINSIYGYRTSMSMSNIHRWKNANKYSSKLLMIFGLILILVGHFLNAIVALILLPVVFVIVFLLVEWKISKVD